ncbi:N-acetylglucosamine-6-phosphate deacetylase [Massilia dura]|uniref:N-acetylglucosamine-6-phosphate deacetylase n=1 Tax=Pseudoduganella dura TaxID=321982 RepID=A0A6I3XCS2_9BURK|nr:N-acetylglucosamine-6-phosphate deacetylase [Pseudoduganella dura]MUI12340.1 N-acetylglucosamine-6-phosphate deacetylase [Pseudoduganella dura]GGX99587.1 N-acetylglucosamine-6-phosphate deacetylase [Pseudoduganella dura]
MLSGRILTPGGWIDGSIDFGQRISEIRADSSVDTALTILPGFIDLHVHGAAGADIMQGGDAAATIARAHARHGTTAMLGTTMTATDNSIRRALRGMAPVIEQRPAGGARMLGAHLEGPFLSIHRLGAQPADAVVVGSMDLVRSYHELAPIRVMTLATEVADHLALIPQLNALGIRVQIGHSNGTYEDGVAALKAGAAGFTHLYNGMTGLRHQEAGIVGAALAHAEYAEIIPDLQHVQPGAILAALRAIPRLYGITDATSATGMPDGEYGLGSQLVYKCRGCVRLATGSLAGSVLTMDQALRNFVGLGLDLADASNRLSLYPADYLGEAARGRLAPGAWADIVVLDADLQPVAVFVEGEAIDLSSNQP